MPTRSTRASCRPHGHSSPHDDVCRSADESAPAYDGIQYLSKYGDDLECWALFEGRGGLEEMESLTIDLDDPDLVEAADLLRVVLAP